MLRTLIILILVASQYFVHAQAALRLMNGQTVYVNVVEQNDSLGFIFYNCYNGKVRKVRYDEVYSLEIKGKPKRMFYIQDSLNNQLSAEEMHFYLLGEKEARYNYRPKGFLWGGIGIGVGSVYLMPALTLSTGYSPILASGAGWGTTLFPVKKIHAQEPEMLNNKYFVSGYKSVAKRKRNRRMFLGVGIGLAAGVLSMIALQ